MLDSLIVDVATAVIADRYAAFIGEIQGCFRQSNGGLLIPSRLDLASVIPLAVNAELSRDPARKAVLSNEPKNE